jgi:hypothetical protein
MHALLLGFSLLTQNALPVDALVYSTMPSTFDHRPQMAMDGDPKTTFRSYYGFGDGDGFTVLLGRPVAVRSIRVTTGNGQDDLLTDATLEVSADGKKFVKAADFDAKGVATASRLKDLVIGIRIRMNPSKAVSRLEIGEITLDSVVPVGNVFRGPGRGFVDVSRFPELTNWAAEAERKMQSFWDESESILYSEGFVTPNAVNVVYRSGPEVTPVAAAGGGTMTVNADYAKKNPKDTGLTVHEGAHIIQSGGSPGWLVEAVADYVRWIRYEPQNLTYNIDLAKGTPRDPYRNGAAFLAWCEMHYDAKLVTKLNDATRFGKYKDELFLKYCGKSIDDLYKEFIEAYKKDKANLLVKPLPLSMRPRPLPTVTGASTAVAFPGDIAAITADGAKFAPNAGFDDGGAAFSANLLKSPVKTQGVTFNFDGRLSATAAKGQTVGLSGTHKSLWILASAIEGGQRDQVLTVTYADGTTAQIHQNFSDWFQPENFPGEARAVKMPYRNLADGTRDPRPFYAYAYGFPLEAKPVKSLTLPNNPNVRIVAITMAD